MADLQLQLNISSPQYKDLLVQNGDLVIVSGRAAIQQDIIQRMSFFAGEWFMDNTQGLPWFQQILVKNPDQGIVDAIFRNVIFGVPGVVSLTQYSFKPNLAARLLNISFIASTTQGTVSYSGAIPPINGATA